MRNELHSTQAARITGAAVALGLLCLTACTDDPPPRPPGSEGAAFSGRGVVEPAQPGLDPGRGDAGAGFGGCSAIDLLFVIDNDPSMIEEQTALAGQFGLIQNELARLQARNVDTRIGVVPTAIDSAPAFGFVSPLLEGALLQTPTMDEPWLSLGTPELQARFDELVTLPSEGFEPRPPVGVLQSALLDRAGPGGLNQRFFRDDALLAVVLLSDGDDFTTGIDGLPLGPERLVAQLDAFKGGQRSLWTLAILAGDQDPLCTSPTLGSIGYAQRLLELVETANERAVFGSLCDGTLDVPLTRALALLRGACAR